MSLATPDQIVTALKDYGLKVRERSSWRIRGTNYRFDPIGQAWHHDAISEAWPDAQAEDMLANGRSDLRGPLTNDAVDSDSTVILIAYGNANHAGRNEADVINRLKQGLAPLGDARLDPDGDTVVGNTVLWGHECRNTGSGHDVWEQLDAMERLGAALCDVNGWPAAANAGHRELTARKPDPAGFDMFAFRADIARILNTHGKENLFMAGLTDSEQKDLYERVKHLTPAVVERIDGDGVERAPKTPNTVLADRKERLIIETVKGIRELLKRP